MSEPLQADLDRYAELAVRIGLDLQPGQQLLISAPLEAAPLARSITRVAYQSGARLVSALWGDAQLSLIRFQYAPRDSFEEYPAWQAEALNQNVQNGHAQLNITGQDPDLLKDQDPALISTVQRTTARVLTPYYEAVTRNAVNWTIVGAPQPAWAARVFPDRPEADQVRLLWQAIFKVCRLDRPDPVAAWHAHVADLMARRDYLTAKQYAALHYRGPGTDLTLGLADGHEWDGGQVQGEKGMSFVPNLPTEEVFTLPHRERTNGTVQASRPLSYAGQLIENFGFTFENGRVTHLHADKGESLLRSLVETDESAARLGEVALVPNSSPVSQLGILFYNTLYDENAASHLAFGRGYRFTLQNGESATDDEFLQAGGNTSLVHTDFMIGSGELDIDGLTADGRAEPVMRAGEWAFQV